LRYTSFLDNRQDDMETGFDLRKRDFSRNNLLQG
jgi:hypothetical protein